MLADDARPVNGRVITEARIGTSNDAPKPKSLSWFIRLDMHPHGAQNSMPPHGPTS